MPPFFIDTRLPVLPPARVRLRPRWVLAFVHELPERLGLRIPYLREFIADSVSEDRLKEYLHAPGEKRVAAVILAGLPDSHQTWPKRALPALGNDNFPALDRYAAMPLMTANLKPRDLAEDSTNGFSPARLRTEFGLIPYAGAKAPCLHLAQTRAGCARAWHPSLDGSGRRPLLFVTIAYLKYAIVTSSLKAACKDCNLVVP